VARRRQLGRRRVRHRVPRPRCHQVRLAAGQALHRAPPLRRPRPGRPERWRPRPAGSPELQPGRHPRQHGARHGRHRRRAWVARGQRPRDAVGPGQRFRGRGQDPQRCHPQVELRLREARQACGHDRPGDRLRGPNLGGASAVRGQSSPGACGWPHAHESTQPGIRRADHRGDRDVEDPRSAECARDPGGSGSRCRHHPRAGDGGRPQGRGHPPARDPQHRDPREARRRVGGPDARRSVGDGGRRPRQGARCAGHRGREDADRSARRDRRRGARQGPPRHGRRSGARRPPAGRVPGRGARVRRDADARHRDRGDGYGLPQGIADGGSGHLRPGAPRGPRWPHDQSTSPTSCKTP
jgi:hypothetical protein